MSEDSEVLLCQCHQHQPISTLSEDYPLPTYITKPATWFAILDSHTFDSITSATKYRIESYNYFALNGDRIIHACDDCVRRLLGVIPDHINMTHYQHGLKLRYTKKRVGKGTCRKIYNLSESIGD